MSLIHRKENMTTQRYGMAVKLKNEKREYYIENHANVWPEVIEELKKINVKNYSIFLKEDFMFGYLEYMEIILIQIWHKCKIFQLLINGRN